MWYVIQTREGYEEELKTALEKQDELGINRVILPLYEDVWRKGGVGHIDVKKLFPGYLFVEAGKSFDEDGLDKLLRGYTAGDNRLLGTKEKEGVYFYRLTEQDTAFIKSLIENTNDDLQTALMRVSFIRMNGKQIEMIRGPLERYKSEICKLDIPHRRAIVETTMFGKTRRVKFCLRTDADLEAEKDSVKATD